MPSLNTRTPMPPIDLTKVIPAEYQGLWIVLSEDYRSVVASGKTLGEILAFASKGRIMKVPDYTSAYSPSAF